ncbi:permease-like protein [Trypanosoma rangeli]|uniref:Permease-like protein n=1 Tax=Trypanosoma rangeli TaxID=5698 RepID=A0A3S5IQL8_TRYRA|nr:permease-like protein [Trypanosoma rangeli]RNF01028.1 permease-like protein [Trypanosoma rangeli]|eukprot:RNF01028.1 permease-like protein [Trypanosoma rangeli]
MMEALRLSPPDTTNSSNNSYIMAQPVNRHENDPRCLCNPQREPFYSQLSQHKMGSFGFSASSVLSGIRLSFRYTASDVARRPRNCAIGVVAVLLLTFFTGIVLLCIWKVPYILLRLAELSVGEVDMVVMGGSADGPFINYTAMKSQLEHSPQVHGIAPRWVLRALARKQQTGFSRQTGRDPPFTETANANVLVIDSEQERAIGIGRSWRHRDTGFAEAHVFYSLLEYLQLRPNHGERMSIHISPQLLLHGPYARNESPMFRIHRPKKINDLSSFLVLQFFLMNGITEDSFSLLDVLNLEFAVNVLDGIESANGKYPFLLGNVVVMDYKLIVPALAEQRCALGSQIFSPSIGLKLPSLTDLLGVPEMLAQFNLLEMVPIVVVTMKKRRSMYYLPMTERTQEMMERSNAIMIHGVGADFNGSVYFPVDAVLSTFETLNIMLLSSLICVVIGIATLCTILFYSLLNTNVEERQFEFAMIRAQGMNKRHLFTLLMTQSLVFIIPGVSLSVALLVGINALLERLLSRFTAVSPRLAFLPLTPMLLALALGVFLPLLAGWSPLSRALGDSLRDALDVYRQVQNETRVVMIRLEQLGISTLQVFLGAVLVVSGFIVYYMIPLSFVFGNMQFLFLLLDLIFVMMVVGICLAMYVIEPYMERGLLWLMVWGTEKRFLTIVKKNLYDHRPRNSKVFMMVLVSVSTLLSSGVMFVLLSTASDDMTHIFNGADITVISSSFSAPLDEGGLNAFLEQRRGVYVEDWAYHSFPLHNYPQIVQPSRLSTVIGNGCDVHIVAVTERFFNTIFPDYIIEEARDPRYTYKRTVDGKYDLVRSIYEDPPVPTSTAAHLVATGMPWEASVPNTVMKKSYIIPALVASAIRDEMGTEVGSVMILGYKYNVADVLSTASFAVEPRGLMNRVSGFPDISSFPATLANSEVLVPQAYFKTLVSPWTIDYSTKTNIELAPGTVTEIRQKKLFVRLRKDISAAKRITFVNEIQAHLNLIYHTVSDTQASTEELRVIRDFIMYFFYFTSVICILLCALMVWITFVSNVRLNARTFVLLQALGCRKCELARVILYEALSIVLSAFMLGFIVGILVGMALGLQLAVLMVLPFRFSVPCMLGGVLFSLSIIAAVIGSMLPFSAIAKKRIGSVLRAV